MYPKSFHVGAMITTFISSWCLEVGLWRCLRVNGVMGSARAFSEEEEGLELGPCSALLSNTLCSRKVSPDAGTILLTSNLQSYRQSDSWVFMGRPALGIL